MRLQYLPVNQAWAFFWEGGLVPMGERRIFDSRDDAVAAARAQGLTVKMDLTVEVAS
jgi:hypothetical protein